MKFGKTLFASVALVASLGAQAQVTGSVGGGAGSFLLLSAPGDLHAGDALHPHRFGERVDRRRQHP